MAERRRKRKAKRGRKPSPPQGLKPGIRMKGGVLFDPQAGGFVVIVHTWDNVACRGEPEEWRHPELFSTEDAAMQCYKTTIRPALRQMMTEMAGKDPGLSFFHRELEE
jgi:hypothetical protein